MILHGYIFMIIKNSGCVFDNEDIEEIASDVFLAIWKNKEKLDINKEIAPYIAGTTKKLILKRKIISKIIMRILKNMKIFYMKKITIYILK